MRKMLTLGFILPELLLLICGCSRSPAPPSKAPALPAEQKKEVKAEQPDEEAEIQKNLAQLSPGDRKIAQMQKYCAVSDDGRLGSMGVPVKIELKGRPVFLCCGHCRKEAEKHPDETLAKAAKLMEQNGGKAAP